MKAKPHLKKGWLTTLLTAGIGLATTNSDAASLLHHWKLDGNANDSAGSDNGTEEGGATYTTGGGGQFGEAVSLDGVDDAIRIGTSPVPATDYTLTAWVFWEDGNGHRGTIAGAQVSGSEGEVFTMSRATTPSATDKKLFLNLLANGGQGGSITESADNTISVGVWQHVAYSVSSTGGTTLYLNGGVVGTNPTRTTHNPSTLNNFSIGARADSTTANPGWFDGLIDDVAIFDGVLDSTQLADVISLGAENFDASNVDATPPSLLATTPDAGATGVLASSTLLANFDEVVVAGTSGTITLRRTAPDELVEAFDVTSSTRLTFPGTTVEIDPTDDLLAGVEYYVLIDAGAIEDPAGNDYAGLSAVPPAGGAWSFTVDGTPPTGGTMGPMNGAPDVLPRADLVLGFDEDVKLGAGTITVHLASDDSVVQTIDVTGGAVTIDGSEVTIDLSLLDLDTDYYVNITAGAFTDLSGNPYGGINDDSTWAFRTVATTLIHHWQFEGDATDSAGIHDGVLEGDATFATGLIGQALSLDGDGDSVFVDQASLPATDFTLTAWVNPSDNSSFNYVAGTQQSGSLGAFLRVDDGVAFFNLLPPAGSKRASGGTVPAATWTHLAVTVDSVGGLIVYVNGSPVGSDPTGIDHSPYDNFRIGARPDGATFGFDGLIDDVRIYAEVLSEAGIAALASGAPPLVLKITRSGGALDFEWNSLEGMQYDLVTSTDLTTPITTWAVYDEDGPGGTDPYADIPATGTSTMLTGVQTDGAVRFFALLEEEMPPLFTEDFESGATGFTIDTTSGTPWSVGGPDSSGPGGAVAAGNGGTNNCAATNLGAFAGGPGDRGYFVDPTVTRLRSGVIDLTGVTAAALSFAEALDLEQDQLGDSIGVVDSAEVYIIDDTDDNPATNVIAGPIYSVTDAAPTAAAWGAANGGTPITIPGAALGQAVRIEWRFTGNGGSTDDYLGWYVDDVAITETTP